MSASAKPTEKLFKSFLAAVLAISLCPLMPADKAQAEEAGDSGEPADAAQMSDEGLGGDADPTEGALAADNSDADPELAGGNDGTEDEGALDDSNVALQAANDSGTPIVNWTKCGTCQWMIDSSGCLIIKPANGESGSLENWDSRGWYPEDISPWRSHADKIVSAKVENGVIAKTTRGMFCKCSEVVSIDLSGLDTSEVADMRSMFSDCSSLVSLDLSSLDTSSVTDMSGMFRDCSKLASLGLSSFDTSSVTSMSSMFSGCSSLASLGLSSFDTSSVTSMYCMFEGCSSLASLDLSSFDTSSVISMCPADRYSYGEGMFSGCSSLKSLDLSSFDTSSVADNNHEIMDMRSMFSGCSSLSSLDLSSFDTSKVTNMSFMFEGCLRLETLNLSSFNAGNVVDMSFMFEDCQSLKTISFPAVLNTSKVTNFSRMFSGCRSLKGLDVSGLDTSAATSLSSMFSGCTKLAALDVSNFDTSAATSLDWMFYGCESLRSLDLSGFDTSAADYRSGLLGFLDGCKSLRTVTLGQEFAFEGAGLDRQCSLPTPKGDRLTGRWVSSADGMAYAPNDIPSNMAATYTAQVAAFTDVDYSDSSWYGDAVSYVVSRGLITGYTDGDKAGQFGVGDVLTRAQLATILWRNACPDEYASYDPETAKDTTGILGSADGMYYTAAANWAVRNGVITGFDREDGSKDFAADENVSFEQLVTILARLCATSGELSAAGSDLSAFADGDLASSWSRGAFAWAAARGLVQGYDEPTGKYLRPGDSVARERVAVVLMRAFEMGIMK